MEILEITDLSLEALKPLLEESRAEGFEFVVRLANEYRSGVNRFQQAGEFLVGAYQAGNLIGICGLNRDPYLLNHDDIARVRHLYVLPAHRKHGVGKVLMQVIITQAKKHFRLLTLRTFNPEADLFYRAIGFQPASTIEHATHFLKLETSN